ncbi:MAG: HigA family addiction module antitoxin, partial [Opitutaceae bacterium]
KDTEMKTKLTFPHPGRLLHDEFLQPIGVTAYRLAKDIGVPATRIGEILAGRRGITAETGLLLDRYFGLSEGYWSGLQHDFDLRQAKRSLGARLAAIHPLSAA